MKSLQELLANKKIPGVEADMQRRICADTASALLKIKLPANKFVYKAGELSTSISPLLKTELILHKEEYEALLRAQGLTLTAIR